MDYWQTDWHEAVQNVILFVLLIAVLRLQKKNRDK